MTGTLSDALANGALASLQNIDVSNNKLTGVIPDAYNGDGVLPELVTFNLAKNGLTGGTPSLGTAGCQNVLQLNIDNNNLRSFPTDWAFSKMQLLSINSNMINDSIPAPWATVVPAGSIVVIMPQDATTRICGDRPVGPKWSQIVDGQPTPVEITTPFVNCGPLPPPLPSPSPVILPPNAPLPPPTGTRSPPPPLLTPPPPPPAATESSGMSTGVIIAIAVGGGVGLIVLVALLFWCCRPKKDGEDGKMAGGMQDGQIDGMEAGYYTADGKWMSTGPNGGAMMMAGGAAVGAAGLAAMATNSSGGSGLMGGPGSGSFLQENGSYDPLLEWAQRQQGVSEADLAAAVGTASSPIHLRSQSRGNNLPLDVKMWTLNFRDLKLEKQIGEGSFGRVYFAWWNETPVAVKILIGLSNTDDEDSPEALMSLSNPMLDDLAKESSMMAALRHPNVVGFLGVCLGPPCIVTEYCARGSLTDVLRGGKASPAKAALLDWTKRTNMALDAAKGMLYLHAHAPPIIHRDLKSPNLLVDKHWRVKVSDFNLSKLMDEGSVMSSMAATNPRWLAPEILTGNNATFASDVYSFAIVMWELLTWDLPWGPTNPWQVVTVVTEGGRLEIPARQDLPGPDTMEFEGLEGYLTLMRRCWAHNPEDRPTFQEIIAELRDLLAAELARTKGNRNNGGGGGGGAVMSSPLRQESLDTNATVKSTSSQVTATIPAADAGGAGASSSSGVFAVSPDVALEETAAASPPDGGFGAAAATVAAAAAAAAASASMARGNSSFSSVSNTNTNNNGEKLLGSHSLEASGGIAPHLEDDEDDDEVDENGDDDNGEEMASPMSAAAVSGGSGGFGATSLNAGYASTAGMTGSLADVGDLSSGWASKLGFGSKKSRNA